MGREGRQEQGGGSGKKMRRYADKDRGWSLLIPVARQWLVHFSLTYALQLRQSQRWHHAHRLNQHCVLSHPEKHVGADVATFGPPNS